MLRRTPGCAALCSQAFTPRRVDALRQHIQDIADRLLDPLLAAGEMDLIAKILRARCPAIVTASCWAFPSPIIGIWKEWSADFAEMLGNFQL